MSNKKRNSDTYTEPNIKIGAAACVVPFQRIESYFQEEIANEGALRKDVPLIIVYPQGESRIPNPSWTKDLFATMAKVRVGGCEFPINVGTGIDLDVGLIDIQVFFDGAQTSLEAIMRSNPQSLLTENLKHFEQVVSGAFHDQMTLVSALHILNPSGTFRLHYHNVVFGLRREGNLAAQLDCSSLMGALSNSLGKVSFVG